MIALKELIKQIVFVECLNKNWVLNLGSLRNGGIAFQIKSVSQSHLGTVDAKTEVIAWHEVFFLSLIFTSDLVVV